MLDQDRLMAIEPQDKELARLLQERVRTSVVNLGNFIYQNRHQCVILIQCGHAMLQTWSIHSGKAVIHFCSLYELAGEQETVLCAVLCLEAHGFLSSWHITVVGGCTECWHVCHNDKGDCLTKL